MPQYASRPGEAKGGDGAYFRDPINPGGLRGRAALLAYFQELLKRNPDWQWVRQEVFPTEDGFALKWRATFPFPSDVVEIDGLDIVVIEDGKIARNEVYFDTAPLAKFAERGRRCSRSSGRWRRCAP